MKTERVAKSLQRWTASPAPRTATGGLALRAGPLTAELLGPNLRWLRAGGTDLVQRIYVAVRDTSFNTIMPRVRITSQRIEADRFEVRIHARHRDRDIDVAWRGWITGSPEGRITYRMVGRALRAFSYNKIGLCVLHPTATHAGRPVTGDGSPEGPFRATLPTLVGPQAIRDGSIRGIIPPFRRLSVELAEGVLELDFDGDDFEMEDERNWTETGFKSYSGPLSRPWPLEASTGMTIRQSVTIAFRGRGRPIRPTRPSVSIGGATGDSLPFIGHAIPADRPVLTPAEASLARLARPSYLQADLRFDGSDDEHLATVASTVDTLKGPLLASLYLGHDRVADLERFVRWRMERGIPLQGVILLGGTAATALGSGTPADTVESLLPTLRTSLPGIPVAVGSDRFLSEIIRTAPSTHGADAIAFGVTPGGHTDEDWSILDSLPAQGDAVRTLQAALPGVPIYAGPVTLQTRFGSWPRLSFEAEPLPLQVDVRQRSLLAAAWTLGSLRELTLAHAFLATYFETVGWRGLFEGESGSANPAHFPSRALEVFPLLHLFADIGELRDHALLDAEVQGTVTGLCFARGERVTVLAANLSPGPIDVRIGPFGGERIAARVLDSHALAMARRRPTRFRGNERSLPLERRHAVIPLTAYACVRVEGRRSGATGQALA